MKSMFGALARFNLSARSTFSKIPPAITLLHAGTHLVQNQRRLFLDHRLIPKETAVPYFGMQCPKAPTSHTHPSRPSRVARLVPTGGCDKPEGRWKLLRCCARQPGPRRRRLGHAPRHPGISFPQG